MKKILMVLILFLILIMGQLGARINAGRIELSANDILNLLAGNEINLGSKRITIASENFSVDRNGNILAKGGTVGGFNLTTNYLNGTLQGIYNYDEYDAENVLAMDLDLINKDSSFYDIYDVNKDGNIDSLDALKILRIINGQTTNDIQVSGTFNIDSKDPKRCIAIKKNGEVMAALGVNGVNSKLVTAENIVCGVVDSNNRFKGVTINGTNGNIQTTGGFSSDENGNVKCTSVVQTSLASEKKNFERMEDNALDIINQIDLYKYNLKSEENGTKKHIGFVIGDDYKYSKEVTSTDNNGVDNYSFTSLCCKAIQEQQIIIEQLQREIKELKEEKKND